uniref:Zinc finger, CCHC-type n=1 Tax=Tanacetum cinerariifolium TaxID=118510 RepID=A0A6L2KVT1_TANCI|nr:zinc finger, CCHC-type [Tanacetum cinerariifolium]
MLLTSLPSSYENFMETLLKKLKAKKEEAGDGLYVRGRSDHSCKAHSDDSSRFKSMGRTSKLKCFICHSDGHLKRDCPRKKSSGFVKIRSSGNREAEAFQVSNDDVAMAQRRLEDKQPEEKTNTNCLVKEQEKVHLGIQVGANITVTEVPGQEGAEGNVAKKKKVKESMKANLEKLLKYNAWSTRWSLARPGTSKDTWDVLEKIFHDNKPSKTVKLLGELCDLDMGDLTVDS